ncbi:unnamed protein product [Thelazia callipaeda]|uniref:IMV envelope protein n=1 Tax=Thelazia callipaeda TaxID=103827 RepID=A0A0N5CRS8_THECL|nr:unnamed protein product [Thelazia callipaeda]
MSDDANKAEEINVAKLVSDVSNTLSGFKNLFIPTARASAIEAAATATHYDTPASNIFTGNVCFKACGMEDIQAAAQKASELFVTLRYCIITITLIAIFGIILLSLAIGWYLMKSKVTTTSLETDSSAQHKFGATSILNNYRHHKIPSLVVNAKNINK